MSIESPLSGHQSQPATPENSGRRQLLRRSAVGGLACAVFLAGAASKDLLFPTSRAASHYGVQVYQQADQTLGRTTYGVEASITSQPSAGTTTSRQIVIGHIVCHGQPDAPIIFDGTAFVNPEQAQAANDQLGPLCAATGALEIDAAQQISRALTAAGVTVS